MIKYEWVWVFFNKTVYYIYIYYKSCTVETATADSLGIQITKYSDECSGLSKSEVCSEISIFLLGAQGQKKTFKFVLHLKSKFNVYYIFIFTFEILFTFSGNS